MDGSPPPVFPKKNPGRGRGVLLVGYSNPIQTMLLSLSSNSYLCAWNG